MMLQLVNDNPKYTWDNKWIQPNESIWGIFQKFKSANVLNESSLNEIIEMSSKGARLHFYKPELIYGYSRFIMSDEFPNVPRYNLDCFQDVQCLLDYKIRYCPECIKQGYHSLYHQLTFFDNCYLHRNLTLKYMCDCTLTYIMKKNKRKDEFKSFQCECGKKLAVPSATDGIIGLWAKPIENFIPNLKNIKLIKVIDFNSYLNDELHVSKLNSKCKKVLNDYFFIGKSNIKPIFYDDKKQGLSEKYFDVDKYIHNKIIEKYGVEEYKRHYYSIERRRKYDIENYNPKIYAAIFLLYDLMSKGYVDQLYCNSLNYGIANRKYFFNDIMLFLRRFFNYDENTFYMSSSIQNFLYKMIIKECFRQLEKCYLSGNKDDFPISGHKIEYKNTFPVFILIEDTEGNISLYK